MTKKTRNNPVALVEMAAKVELLVAGAQTLYAQAEEVADTPVINGVIELNRVAQGLMQDVARCLEPFGKTRKKNS